MKLRLIVAVVSIFICGTAFSQLYTPVNPAPYGQNFNRVKPFLSLHMPEKSSLTTDTYDTTAQMFYYKADSSVWAWSKARGYFKIGTGGGSGGGPAGAPSWLMAGNANTNRTTDFLGTTNNTPLLVRINNIPRGGWDTATYNGSGLTGLFSIGNKLGMPNNGKSALFIADSARLSGDELRVGIMSFVTGGKVGGVATQGQMFGAHIESRIAADNTASWTAYNGMSGVRGGVNIQAGALGSIVNTKSIVGSADFSAMAVTNRTAFYAENAIIRAPASLVNQYGLYIEQLTGAVNNYGIYSQTGNNIIAPPVTIGDGVPLLGITGTMFNGGSSNQVAVPITVTAQGSTNVAQMAMNAQIIGAYNGTALTIAGNFSNTTAGGGNIYGGNTSNVGYRVANGNIGFAAASIGTSIGINNAARFLAGGGFWNYGSWSSATVGKAGSVNIGVLGFGLNAGGNAQVGGFFALADYGTSAPSVTSAALIADNGATTSPVQLWRDNGTIVGTVADGGSISTGTASAPAASAQLDVVSTTKGMLPPRMTAANRLAIASPAIGLLAFDTDSSSLFVFTTFGWRNLWNISSVGSSITYPYSPKMYLTGYGTFGSITDSARYAISAGGGIVYNPATGVISATNISNGTVTGFTSNDLSPLFTTNVLNPSTVPGLIFSASPINQYEILGRKAAGSGAYSFLPADSSLIPGMHTQAYYDARYAPIGGGGSAGWALTGNAISSGNFLGTTNSMPLNIFTNNVRRFSIDATGESFFEGFPDTGGFDTTLKIYNQSVNGFGLYVRSPYVGIIAETEGSTYPAAITGTNKGVGGIAIGANTNDGIPIALSNITAAGNTATVAIDISTGKSLFAGSGAGIGSIIRYRANNSSGTSVNVNDLVSKLLTVTAGNVTSEFSITGINVNTQATLFSLLGTGKARLYKYGVGTFTGTATRNLQVDASGNIIEGSLSSGNVQSNLALGTATVSTLPITNSDGTGFTLPSFSTTAGLVPGTATGTTLFLRQDGTWQIPSGGTSGGTFRDTTYKLQDSIHVHKSTYGTLSYDTFRILPLSVTDDMIASYDLSKATGLLHKSHIPDAVHWDSAIVLRYISNDSLDITVHVNGKRDTVVIRDNFTVTALGTSGPSTYNLLTHTLNVPQYSGGGGGGGLADSLYFLKRGGNTLNSATDIFGSYNNVSLRFMTNGTEGMVLDSIGQRLGLGIVQPLEKLHLKGNIRIHGTTGTDNVFTQYRADGTTLMARMTSTESTNEWKITAGGTLGTGGTVIFNAGGLQFSGDVQSNSKIIALANGTGKVPLEIKGLAGTTVALLRVSKNGAATGDMLALDSNARMSINNLTPSASAQLDIASTTRGLLVPRMTAAQRLAIASPAIGLFLFDLDSSYHFQYTATGWKGIISVPGSGGGGGLGGTISDGRILFSAGGLVKDTSTLTYDRATGDILTKRDKASGTRLTIENSSAAFGAEAILNLSNGNSANASIGVFGTGTSTTAIPVGSMRVYYDGVGELAFVHGGTGDLTWNTLSGGSIVERMAMKQTGTLALGTSSPSASALLDVSSITKGVLAPRMTTVQMNAIVSPALGLLVTNTDSLGLCEYNGTAWRKIRRGAEDVETLTNKRITRRAPAITQSATPIINTDATDVVHITGLAQAITSMSANLTGTPVNGDVLRIDITDDGSARAIVWGTSFEGSTVGLPSTTVAGARLDMIFTFNPVTSKWRVLGVQ